jgi:hypothetical protein
MGAGAGAGSAISWELSFMSGAFHWLLATAWGLSLTLLHFSRSIMDVLLPSSQQLEHLHTARLRVPCSPRSGGKSVSTIFSLLPCLSSDTTRKKKELKAQTPTCRGTEEHGTTHQAAQVVVVLLLHHREGRDYVAIESVAAVGAEDVGKQGTPKLRMCCLGAQLSTGARALSRSLSQTRTCIILSHTCTGERVIVCTTIFLSSASEWGVLYSYPCASPHASMRQSIFASAILNHQLSRPLLVCLHVPL